MATATLTSQLTDVLIDPGVPTLLGTGNSANSETVIHLQGTSAAAIGHAGAVGPTAPTAISQYRGMYNTVTAFTRTAMHLHLWVRDLYPIRNKNVGGVSAYIFGTSEAIYYSTGLDKGYVGGWYHLVLNLDPGDRPAASLGTAPSTDITRIGYCGNISATKLEAFLENCYYDAVRRGGDGSGVTFTGGTSGDRLTIANCVTADTARYGMLQNVGGALFIEGPITFGSATATTYLQDNLKTITFTGFEVANGASGGTTVPAVAVDYYGLVLADGTTGITDIRLTDVVFNGFSRAIPFTFTNNIGAGDAFVSLRTSWIFGRNLQINTATAGATVSSTNDVFVECVGAINPLGIALTNASFSNCDAVTLTTAGAAITGGTVNKHNTAVNVAFITTNDPSKVSNTAFDNTGGVGHAMRATAIGTFAFNGNTSTGYGADASSSAFFFNDSFGLITLNVGGGGSTPTVRNGTGASTVINATITVTFAKMKDNSEVRVYRTDTGAEIAGIENVTAGTTDSRTFAWSAAVGLSVFYVIHNFLSGVKMYTSIRVEGYIVPATATTIDIQQVVDRNVA